MNDDKNIFFCLIIILLQYILTKNKKYYKQK
jgi:hypothetical protein